MLIRISSIIMYVCIYIYIYIHTYTHSLEFRRLRASELLKNMTADLCLDAETNTFICVLSYYTMY